MKRIEIPWKLIVRDVFRAGSSFCCPRAEFRNVLIRLLRLFDEDEEEEIREEGLVGFTTMTNAVYTVA